MRKFCANCGIEESEGIPIIDNLCIRCFTTLKKIVKIPNTIEIPICSRCGALLISGRWYYPTSAKEAREIIEKQIVLAIKPSEGVSILSVDAKIIPPSYREARVLVELLINNRHDYTLESKVDIVWIKRLCPTCFQRAGKGFDAVIQIRFVHIDESAEKFKKDVMKMFQDYVVEVREADNGYDIKVSSQSIARKIADLAKKNWKIVKIVESFGDVKRSRDGTRHARLYISVRVVNPKVGDYIVLEGKAYTVTKVNDEGITVMDSDGFRKTISFNELQFLYEKSKTRLEHR